MKPPSALSKVAILLGALVRPVDRAVVRMLIGLIHGYQRLLSPLIGGQCRFHPTCSCYAAQALTEHGTIRGVTLLVWRLLRCQPFAAGGFDPVPSSHAPAHSLTTQESKQHATH